MHRLVHTGFSKVKSWHGAGLGESGWYGTWTFILGEAWSPAFSMLSWVGLPPQSCTGSQARRSPSSQGYPRPQQAPPFLVSASLQPHDCGHPWGAACCGSAGTGTPAHPSPHWHACPPCPRELSPACPSPHWDTCPPCPQGAFACRLCPDISCTLPSLLSESERSCPA